VEDRLSLRTVGEEQVMVSEKTLYWLAVGVLSLAAINSTVARHQEWIASAADGSLEVAQRVADQAMRAVDQAGTMVGRTNTTSPRVQYAAARVQGRLARVQARIALQQASLERVQAEQVRMVTLATMKHVIACPHFEVQVPEPDFEISDDSK
jgi:hypothetical protein